MIQRRICTISITALGAVRSVACDVITRRGRDLSRRVSRQRSLFISCLAILMLALLTSQSMLAQDNASQTVKEVNPNLTAMLNVQPQTSTPAKRLITIKDAVSIFLQQNLQLVAARYDIDSADAEKLTARLRPNPQLTLGLSGLPLSLSGPFISEQTYSYGISQTIELGGKRSKRIAFADANSELARGQFQMVVWQLTNDLKRKFYTVLLDQSLLNLAKENQTTFADIVKHTTELLSAGEMKQSSSYSSAVQ